MRHLAVRNQIDNAGGGAQTDGSDGDAARGLQRPGELEKAGDGGSVYTLLQDRDLDGYGHLV